MRGAGASTLGITPNSFISSAASGGSAPRSSRGFFMRHVFLEGKTQGMNENIGKIIEADNLKISHYFLPYYFCDGNWSDTSFHRFT
ncbi:hypothetical protein PEP31012_04653 [Pandoraea eparura]|uniref:Uncharacterized protein n=1 Tax=Pandoraea eparura TaxID=2508291 RepID=A0A5E4YNP7_9BURK|nr:hypothetical protein PEP31012_04653 [Pandoraea eparura]